MYVQGWMSVVGNMYAKVHGPSTLMSGWKC